jgi:hypothetical protein
MYLGKLRSKWTGPYIVRMVYLHEAVEIENLECGNIFKVNGQRLKSLLKLPNEEQSEKEEILLGNP